MSLALAYANKPLNRRAVNALIIHHFDAHGTATAAARARILRRNGEDIGTVSKFPEAGPRGLSDGSIRNLVEGYAPQRIELIDIPIDVRNPEVSIKTLTELAAVAPVYVYDHHETDLPFVQELHRRGIYATVVSTGLELAMVLRLFDDVVAKELAVIGIVADRDKSVVKVTSVDEIEQRYLPLANRLDVIVRNPRIVGLATPGEVAERLAEEGAAFLESINVDYPPERLAAELQSKIVEEGDISILVDWSDAPWQVSQWVPKTLEQLLLLRRRHIAIAVVPGYNPRTRAIEGYDVRVLRYWLAPETTPVPEELVKDVVPEKAARGEVVGHADYVSIRYGDVNEARAVARRIFNVVEGSEPTVSHLVNDQYVAEAVRRDYKAILERLSDILEEMRRMYREYLELKRRQVELLERTSNHRYD